MRSVTANGVTVEYQLTYKSVKNLNLLVQRDGTVQVSAPKRASVARVDEFVLRNMEFILKAQKRLAARPKAEEGVIYYMGQRYNITEQPAARDAVRFDGENLLIQTTRPGDAAHQARILDAFDAKLAKQLFPDAVAIVLPLLKEYGVKMPSVTARSMTSRWGSCTMAKGSIRLNTQLVHFPPKCLKQVALHELCHFVHPDHSDAFYALMTRLMPDWKESKQILAQGSPYLRLP